MPSTPEHILWAIEHACPLRNLRDWADPEQTERELRPLRAYCEARQDGRVFEGICLEQATADLKPAQALGFPAAEIFDAYGEGLFLEATCGKCPANLPQGDKTSLAGCHGWFITQEIKPRLNRIIDDLKSSGRDQQLAHFPLHRFQQAFYALWTHSIWRNQMLSQAVELFCRVAADDGDEAVTRFAGALRSAQQHGCAMRVKLMPRGEREANCWTVAAHCPNCLADWSDPVGRCRACDYRGGAAPARRRSARGNRPFIPLGRIIGEQNVDEFLVRYAQQRLSHT